MTTPFSTVRDDALGTADVVDLLGALRRSDVSADELTDAALARSRDAQEALNPVVCWVDRPAVRPGAEQAPLAGIPTFVKDSDDLAGLPTREGSRAVPDHPATEDSSMVALYRGLGVNVLGKSTMPEFGLTATTEPMLTGPTRNPWDPGRITGGSSGGSAALVASGAVPIAHANDGGGSIRIPAACCGLVGLKPSNGRLPVPEDSTNLPVQIVSQGVLTRSVRDTALFYAEVERAWPSELPPIGRVEGTSARRLRIGVIPEGLTGPVSPEVAAATAATAELCAGLGHHVETTSLPVYDKFGRDFLRYWAALAFALRLGGPRLYGPNFDRELMEPFSVGLAEYFAVVAGGIPASIRRLRGFAGQYARYFDDFDVLLSPTVGYVPPEVGYLSPELDFRTHITRLLRFAGYTAVQNVAGTPGLSLPLGASATGVPIGLHFASALGDERTLLELAFELEAASPWPTTPPHM